MKDADEYDKLWKSGAFKVDQNKHKHVSSTPTNLNPNITPPPMHPSQFRLSKSGELRRNLVLVGGISILGLLGGVVSQKYIEESINSSIANVRGYSSEMVTERKKWLETLGREPVEIKPLPGYLTSEVSGNLEKFGFKLIYIPSLNLGNRQDIGKLGVPKYLDELEKKYPKWRPYEKSWFFEPYLFNLSGNLDKNYWERYRNINYPGSPSLVGQWAAIEKIPRPQLGFNYENVWVSNKLGINNRFGVSYTRINQSLKTKEGEILSELGLTNGQLRLPTALEYNLIFNHWKMGSDSREWTSDGAVGGGSMVVGGSEYPYGASQVSHAADSGWGNVGFRVGIFFP